MSEETKVATMKVDCTSKFAIERPEANKMVITVEFNGIPDFMIAMMMDKGEAVAAAMTGVILETVGATEQARKVTQRASTYRGTLN